MIVPLTLDTETNNYKIMFPIETYLSKKENIEFVDIQIVDEKGDIVNVNGSEVQVVFYFYSS